MRTRSLVLAQAMLLASMAVATVSSQAAAWTGPSRIVASSSAPLNWCPGAAAVCRDDRRLTTLAPRTAVTMVCWVDAASRRWFYIKSGGHQGFVRAGYVINQNPSTPWCLDYRSQTRRAVAASLWSTSVSEYNQRQPTAADRSTAWNVYSHSLAAWGTKVDWSGDCVMFVGLAWYRSGTKIRTGFGTAEKIGRYYAEIGQLRTSGTPPRGSAIFWASGGVGHVAISLGNGRAVTTRGYDDDLLLTTDKLISSMGGRYMGWVPTP